MRIGISLGILLLVCSCLPGKQKESANFVVPEIYTLNSLPEISVNNDVVFFNDKRYSGYLIETDKDSNDTLSLRGYLNGLQNGVEIKWFPGKKIMEKRTYLMGKKHGKQIAYWENGLKKFEFIANNDAYDGELKEWNSDGRLIHLANYKDGQEEGVQKMWYENGKIRANYVIIEGKRYGLLGTKNCTNVSDSIFNAK